MNGMEMLFSAMGIDPAKIAADFSVLKDQVILTLKSIESKLEAIETRLELIENAGRNSSGKSE